MNAFARALPLSEVRHGIVDRFPNTRRIDFGSRSIKGETTVSCDTTIACGIATNAKAMIARRTIKSNRTTSNFSFRWK
ncbi:MAG: hypothetical protein WBD31_13700 [Rubripirellula sp.]